MLNIFIKNGRYGGKDTMHKNNLDVIYYNLLLEIVLSRVVTIS